MLVQWDKVGLMLIFQCILGLQSQISDLKNKFSQADIPNWVKIFIQISRGFKSNGEKFDVVLILNKILFVQDKDTRLWYEKLQYGLLDHGFVVRKVDLCLLMYKALVFVAYMYDCLF